MIGSFAIFKTKRVIIKATYFDSNVLCDYSYNVKCSKEIMEITPITFKDNTFTRNNLLNLIQSDALPLIETFFGRKCIRLERHLRERKRYVGFDIGLTGVKLLVVSFES